jgi:hypothetical protein
MGGFACSRSSWRAAPACAGFGSNRHGFEGTPTPAGSVRGRSHIVTTRQVDVRLTRAVVRELRDELRSDARIDLRGPGFDWVLIRVRNAADVERAIGLLRHAIRAARA